MQSRGEDRGLRAWGKTRGDHRAAAHDRGGEEKRIPFGLVDEGSGRLHLTFGGSSKTGDFIADSLRDWWNDLPVPERTTIAHLQLEVDNGPESGGARTRFLERPAGFADHIGEPVHPLHCPPYRSKYNPIERCWGILEQHWNGTKLVDVDTMLEWAKSVTRKGIRPIVKRSRTACQKGISLPKKAMREVEPRLERNPLLPKWDILVRPA